MKYLLLLAVVFFFGCKSSRNSGIYSNGDKILFLETFYKSPVSCEDTVAVNYPQVDIFRNYLDFQDDNSKHLIYVSSDDCSVCIAELLDFLKTYSFIENDFPFFLLVKSESRELVDYYIKQDLPNFNKKNIIRIQNLKTVLIPFDSELDDGMYLLYGNKVVRYAKWKIY